MFIRLIFFFTCGIYLHVSRNTLSLLEVIVTVTERLSYQGQPTTSSSISFSNLYSFHILEFEGLKKGSHHTSSHKRTFPTISYRAVKPDMKGAIFVYDGANIIAICWGAIDRFSLNLPRKETSSLLYRSALASLARAINHLVSVDLVRVIFS